LPEERDMKERAPALRALAFVVWCSLIPDSLASAQDRSSVLIVINSASEMSGRIGAHYGRMRLIPSDNVVRIRTAEVEEVPRDQYEREIEQPIGEWLARNAVQDRILYIVLMKGIPLRVGGTAGRNGTTASVDSELALLYRKLTGVRIPLTGPITNPYFMESTPPSARTPFNHRDHDIYLVSRIDGFTEADAIALIERSAAPVRDGDFFLDSLGGNVERAADRWMQQAADRLAAAGYRERVIHEARAGGGRGNLMGYASWGSNDPALHRRRLGLGFAPGALATIFVSTDARTLQEPPDAWQPRTTTDAAHYFHGSPQTLTGDLIREGVTGVAGHVAEPFTDGAIRPEVLFPAYVGGFNLVESFYRAMPYLSWQTVVFGDPLCAPFRSAAQVDDIVNAPIDSETELPEHFSRRRQESLMSTGISAAAAKLMLVGEARARRSDEIGMRQAYEQATVADPRLNAVHLMLATVYEKAGEYDLAIERYRRVLATAPNEAVAMNNLAYALAVYKNAPKDALPIAEKAYTLFKRDSRIIDTLAWIHYLIGNTSEAEPLLIQAAAGAPNDPDIHLHMAIVYAALGRRDLALGALTRSTQIDPAFADREDVRRLQAQLTGP
jgi:uncharacterized protein (TIGR03790 family)